LRSALKVGMVFLQVVVHNAVRILGRPAIAHSTRPSHRRYLNLLPDERARNERSSTLPECGFRNPPTAPPGISSQQHPGRGFPFGFNSEASHFQRFPPRVKRWPSAGIRVNACACERGRCEILLSRLEGDHRARRFGVGPKLSTFTWFSHSRVRKAAVERRRRRPRRPSSTPRAHSPPMLRRPWRPPDVS